MTTPVPCECSNCLLMVSCVLDACALLTISSRFQELHSKMQRNEGFCGSAKDLPRRRMESGAKSECQQVRKMRHSSLELNVK